MKVTEAAENPSKLFEEAIRGNLAVTSAARKQYLESAREHYLSALAELNAGKQEQSKICDGVDASFVLEENAFKRLAEANRTTTQGQPGQFKTFSEMDIQIQLPNGVFPSSGKQLQAVRVQFNKTLARSSEAQIADMVDRIGTFGKEMNAIDATELEAKRIVPIESSDVIESLSKEGLESSSLQKMVDFLKTELEYLKKEHAELQDNDIGREFGPRDGQFMLFDKLDNEACLGKEAKARETGYTFEEATEDKNEVDDLKNKGKGLNREHNTSKNAIEIEKRLRLFSDADKIEKAAVIALDQSLTERMCAASVSTSESSARMMIPGDELESSSQKPDKFNKLERGTLTLKTGSIEADKYDYASEFSIRGYVFAARNKDVSTNWPFSQKNLQLCLKRGVKNVLPPFKHADSLIDNSAKRYFAEKSLPSEESNLDARPAMMKNLLVPGSTLDHCWKQDFAEGYMDPDSFPYEGGRECAYKTNAIGNSQSEVESVSTNNLPLSEVSDEREAAASAPNKTKSSGSQISNKKCKVAMNMRNGSSRNTPEDITSACTVPSEAMASKICPVCENFSSSSNTTLNAHIDQCLSSESTPNWMKNSKLIKPRIKPKRIRLMADICATAPCCTLEDLDRRNGTNWATNVDVPSEDTEVPSEGRSPGVSTRYVVTNRDDDSVYIDSNGRKIRILSKFNDTSPLSISKAKENLRPKKQSRMGKRSKFFSPNRKRRLAKRLKYLKVTCQRRRFSSFKVKDSSHEACGTQTAAYALRKRKVERLQPASIVKGLKAQEQKNPSVSGTSSRWMSCKTSNLARRSDPEAVTELCRDVVQATKDLMVGSNQVTAKRTAVEMQSRLLKKPLSSLQSRLRNPALDSGEEQQKRQGSCAVETVGFSSVRGAVRGKRGKFPVCLKLGAAEFNREEPKECAEKSSNAKATPASSSDRAEIQPATGSRSLLHSCISNPFKRIRSHNSKSDLLFPVSSCIRGCQSSSRHKDSALVNSCSWREDEAAEVWSAGCNKPSSAQQVINHRQGDSRDTNRSNKLVEEGQGNHVRSSNTGHTNREFISSVSSSSLPIGETTTSASTSLDPELQKVCDVSDHCPKSLHVSDKFQGPLFSAEADRSQHGLRNEHDMFHGDAAAAETVRFELKTGEPNLNFGHGSSFPEMDPIPIPGPPGSDLPSFSDIGSEDLYRTPSLSSSLVQYSGDGDGGNSFDSPLSATSTISNLGVVDDVTVNKQKSLRVTLPVSDGVYAGWSGVSPGSALGFSTVISHVATSESERVATLIDNSKESVLCQSTGSLIPEGDNMHCCCSRKEGIPWSSALSFQESQLLGRRMTSLVNFSGEKHTDSSLNVWPNSQYSTTAIISFSSCTSKESENLARYVETSHQGIPSMEISTEGLVPFPRASDCESASPAPVLRLMGKDLMVINKEVDELSRFQAARNVNMDRQVHPVTEISSTVDRCWDCHSPQSSAFVGPPLREQDQQIFSVQHFDYGPSTMLNNLSSRNQMSGSMYVNKHVHADFNVYGPAPLQR